MPTLQEQLKEIETEELKHELSFPQYEKLKYLLDVSETIAGFIAFFLTVGIFYVIFGVLFSDSEWVSFFFILFYGGVFLVGYLQTQVAQLLKYLAHHFYKISKERLQTEVKIRSEFYKKKNLIKGEIRKAEEQDFIYQLNDFVYQLEHKKVTFDEALITKEQLERKNTDISLQGYKLYTRTYYTNRFKKIEEALKTYGESITANFESIPTKNENISGKDFSQTSFSTNKIIIPSTTIERKIFDKTEETKQPTSNTQMKPVKKTESSISKKNDVIEEEKLISELFENKQQVSITAKEHHEKLPVKIDYLKLQETRQNTGLLGELYAMEWEKKRLEKTGKKLHLDKLIHVSKTDDSLGYDIISYCEDGSPKYIEVKTTTETYNCPFYLTETEILAIGKLHNYFIYRIYNFNIEAGTGKIFTIDCNIDIEKYYKVQPVSYRVSPK